MKRISIKKWILGTLLILLLISIGSCIGVKSQINQHLGAKTEIVDTSIFKSSPSPIAITNVNVLSTDCAKMRDSLTVLIKNGKIESIGKNRIFSNEYKEIDGTGQYLIPGLVDTHVHLKKSKNDLLLYLANGVTTVGEMFGDKSHLQWRTEAETGALSPNIYVATRKIGSRKGLMLKIRSWFGREKNFTTEEKARKAIRRFKKQGYDAIKLSTFLKPNIYQAIIDECKKQNLPAIGHLSSEVGLEGLYTSGQSQLAHVEEIVKSTMNDFGPVYYNKSEEYLTYLRERCDAIAIKIKENNIVVSSTIWLVESFPKQKLELESFIKMIPLEYANPGLVEGSKMAKGWTPGNNSYENLEAKNDPEMHKRSKMFWDTYVKAHQIMTKALIKHNVIITAGTDANVACAIAGFSLHEELISLNNAGLSPAQVLQSATLNAGKWMQYKIGKIEPGFEADLVLLKKNPLENINNTKTIQAVITNGKLLDRETLDKMLLSVKEANNRSRKINIDQYIK
ncbi:amidohydrolase family protein [Aquimarina sp. 2201CG5-10]|uniref:amidohydrolase family protein n=1 Tax=Aquimarina callyspongiae TaxID=3098150 RepID=UPI002AB40DA7|nr:amidohydrolase family protein [Aquimarina sp. 2201CG5-10]MDY8135972.1 amidohydrolase family protein [Aquimarina sp. 2201CG5-10]